MSRIPDHLREAANLPPNGDGDVYGIYGIYGDPKKLPEPAEFPVGAMPVACRGLIRESAEAIGCPPEFVALPMLSVLGSAIANSRVVELKPGWEEKAVIFATVIGDPASKKSPAAKVATRPAKNLQIEMKHRYRDKRDDYELDMMQHERDRKAYQKAGDVPPKEPDAPVMERTVVDDTTVEALSRVLKDCPRGVLVAKDELAGWLRGMDQYKAGGKGSDRQFWLSMWNSDPITVDRKGAPEALMVSEPFVCISGGIQPEVLEDLSRGPEDGMLDRFLVAYPDPVAPGWRDAAISDAAQRKYSDLYQKLRIRHLQTDAYGDPAPQKVYFSSSAKSVLIQAVNDHAEEMSRPGFPPALKGVYGKLEAYLGRLSLVLAMARSVDEGTPEQIEARDVVMADALLRYFKVMARRVYAALRDADPVDSLAEDLAVFLQSKGGQWSGLATELHLELKSSHKPGRPEDLAKLIRKVAKRHNRISLDTTQERVVKEDGKATTKRVMALKLIGSL